MTTNTITSKLHARADKKLVDFIESRIGDFFDMCGRHNAKKIDLGCFPEIKQTLTNLQMPQSFPWHGAVVDLMRQVLFAHLRDKYREAEVLEFMRHVESIAEVQQEMEGDQ